MASSEENILQSLFERTPLNNISSEQLNQLIEDHPYYGAAHFLLAKKLYQVKQSGYQQVLQKTAVHFSNDLWLHFSLNKTDEGFIVESDIAPETEKDE